MNNIEIKLKAPMPYHWKVQTANAYGCRMAAYIDARQVQNTLDKACGFDNWTNEFYQLGNTVYCRIGIWDTDKNCFVYKSDCGAESTMEKEKGTASDAFKRAAVQWGIGRFLYDLKMVKLPSAEWKNRTFYPSQVKGDRTSIIWDKDELDKVCNDKVSSH